VAMELTGQHMPVMKANTDAIAASARHAGANVSGWSAVQGTLNFQIGSFTKGLEAVATEAGQVALPALTDTLKVASAAGSFLASHPALTKDLAIGGGILGAAMIAPKLASAGATALSSVGKVAETLKIPGLDKLANIGSGTGLGGLTTAASGASGEISTLAGAAARAAGALDAVGAAGDKAAAGEVAAGEGGVLGAGGTAATAEGEAAAGAGGVLRSGAGGILAGAMVAAITIPLAAEADKLIQGHLGNSPASGLAQVGTGAAAGAATGAMVGSVIPGLGTVVGAVMGAVAGGITTAMANHNVWNDLVTPPKPAEPAPYAYPGPVPAPYAYPGTGPSPRGAGQEPSVGQQPGRLADVQPKPTPAEPASFAWQRAHQFDENRHHMAEAFDKSRHGIAVAADAVNSAVNTFMYGTGGTSSAGTTFGGGRAGALGDRAAVPAAPRLTPAPPLQYSTFREGPASGTWTSVIGGMSGQAPPPGPAADMSHAAHALAQGGTPGVKIGVTVDTSAITAAKGRIAADLASLSASQGMKPVKIPGPDLSALNAAKGPAAAAGAGVASGFAGGIAAGTGAVAAAAHSLAAAAVAALTLHLQSSSPSKVTKAIGQDGFDAGFAQGIGAGQGAAIAATAALGTSSVSALVQSLEGGSQSLQNALTALYGPLADSQAVTTIAQEIATLQAAHPADSKWLGKQGSKLEQLANQAGALEQQISGAQQIATSVIGGASVMTASGYTAAVPTAGGPQSPQAIASGMQLQAQDAKQFAAALAKDAKLGLNATELSQIAQAGVTAGLPVALGIAQGGKGTVGQLNAYEAQIIKAGGQAGNIGGPAGYQATLAADAAAGGQLKSELSMVGKTMAQVANEVAKATGGSTAAGTSASSSAAPAGSTSTGAAAAGVTQLASGSKSAAGGLSAVGGASHGAAGGLNAVDSAAHAAAAALASIVAAAGAGGSGSGSGGTSGSGTGSGLMPRTGGGGGGAQAQGGGFIPGYHGIGGFGQAPVIHQTTHVHLNVQGSVMSDQDLASHMQRALLQHGSNNWQAGINYPGRSN